jgi:hypothetical protein
MTPAKRNALRYKVGARATVTGSSTAIGNTGHEQANDTPMIAPPAATATGTIKATAMTREMTRGEDRDHIAGRDDSSSYGQRNDHDQGNTTGRRSRRDLAQHHQAIRPLHRARPQPAPATTTTATPATTRATITITIMARGNDAGQHIEHGHRHGNSSSAPATATATPMTPPMIVPPAGAGHCLNYWERTAYQPQHQGDGHGNDQGGRSTARDHSRDRDHDYGYGIEHVHRHSRHRQRRRHRQ